MKEGGEKNDNADILIFKGENMTGPVISQLVVMWSHRLEIIRYSRQRHSGVYLL